MSSLPLILSCASQAQFELGNSVGTLCRREELKPDSEVPNFILLYFLTFHYSPI